MPLKKSHSAYGSMKYFSFTMGETFLYSFHFLTDVACET